MPVTHYLETRTTGSEKPLTILSAGKRTEGGLIGQKQKTEETKMSAQGRHFGTGRMQEILNQTIKLWCGDRNQTQNL
ncbi:hypothetical protein QIY50_14085 [Pseudomonas putida]|nr:hypothetical protein QIY50_14085 [Pseudomonas putida]